MRTFSHKPSSFGGTNRHPLLVAIAILAALATSLAMSFSLGARPAAAQDGETSDYLSDEDKQALVEAVQKQGFTTEDTEEFFTIENPEVSKDPESLSFGNVQTGQSSATQNATVNVNKLGCIDVLGVICVGAFPAKIDSATVSGQGFAEVSDNCQGEISTACSVGVKFQPNSTGAHNGQLNFIPGAISLLPDRVCLPPFNFPCVDLPALNVPTTFTDDTTVDLSGNGVAPPDTVKPSVTQFSPTGKNVKPGANATAKFSEDLLASSISAPGTFTLTKKGSTTPVPAVVTYDPNTDTATLNPNGKLKKGATYTAKITTAAKDLAGNSLDQEKTWTFRVKR